MLKSNQGPRTPLHTIFSSASISNALYFIGDCRLHVLSGSWSSQWHHISRLPRASRAGSISFPHNKRAARRRWFDGSRRRLSAAIRRSTFQLRRPIASLPCAGPFPVVWARMLVSLSSEPTCALSGFGSGPTALRTRDRIGGYGDLTIRGPPSVFLFSAVVPSALPWLARVGRARPTCMSSSGTTAVGPCQAAVGRERGRVADMPRSHGPSLAV